MRSILYSFLLLGLLACSQNPVNRVLSDAESCIQTFPDSALLILSQLDTLSLSSERAKARYALLYSIALDKNYIDTADVQIIAPAVHYYDCKGTARERMLTWYYLGRVQYNAGDDASSMKSLLRASDEAKKFDSGRYQGMIYTMIAELCAKSFCWEDEREYLESAREVFVSVGDSVSVLNLSGRLAMNSFNQGDINSTFSQMDSLESRVSSIQSLYIPFLIERAYVLASPQVMDYDSSFRDFTQAISMGAKLTPKYMAMYASVLDKCGYSDAAQSIYRMLSKLSAEADVLVKYRQMESWEETGQYKFAYEALKSSVLYQNEIVNQVLRQSLFRAQRDYSNLKRQQTQTEKERQSFSLICILLALLLVGGIVSVLVIQTFRRHRMREAEMDRLADSLSTALGEERKENMRHFQENQALKEQFKGLYATQIKMLESTYRDYEQALRTGAGQKELYDKLLGIIHEIKGDDTKQHLFEELIDRNTGNVMTRLREECPGLPKNDRMLFAYTVAGFDKTTICMLLGNISSDALNTRRSRLRNYLRTQAPPSLDFFLEQFAVAASSC